MPLACTASGSPRAFYRLSHRRSIAFVARIADPRGACRFQSRHRRARYCRDHRLPRARLSQRVVAKLSNAWPRWGSGDLDVDVRDATGPDLRAHAAHRHRGFTLGPGGRIGPLDGAVDAPRFADEGRRRVLRQMGETRRPLADSRGDVRANRVQRQQLLRPSALAAV